MGLSQVAETTFHSLYLKLKALSSEEIFNYSVDRTIMATTFRAEALMASRQGLSAPIPLDIEVLFIGGARDNSAEFG